MQRYFIKSVLKTGDQFQLDSNVSKHWLQVMRGAAGDQAEFVDSQEALYLGQLNDDHSVTVVKALESHVELPVEVTILSGLPKQDKAEWIVQKATEMGANSICFFGADWSVAKWQPNKLGKKLTRLQKIAQGAAEQAHRTHIPTVNYFNTLKQAIAELSFDHLLVAYEEAAKQGEQARLVKLLNQVKPHERLVAVFGPEGGISPAEMELLAQNQATVAGLGPRILRTETAPLYFLAAVSTILELQ
ncbi:16S rRNA (uracil(1498)-N(3))-methyltransferase [Lactobacillus sp. LC28-10]|uniref:Ribosomal RNA small subunit methyltransferase E n=1 Tax=Secundilactobacillus angelensis TaxID=2722706 RepID=A0ABX1KZM6_9LACO|nr:16S rRNA (uracil(1498)-N(3))-methyltransferase [Secundilactobacillus angelensis]MCH5461278.1 16S rRNA (uracil(1498)-N(3))-methyltransferase [Secundilactobacillus angelensis]NLR17526.1 16S rRNA (uracil(1498)-N(3))-methyltransferase [Secundilactobacillus angelensis]